MPDNPRIDDLRRRLDREPGSRVFAQLAEELRKAGQLPEAVRVARQGLLVHPGYPSARMTLGRALLDMRDLRGARAEFEAVLRGATDNILASRFLGECLEGLGDLGSALLQYRATLRLAPGDRNLEAQIRALEQKLTPSPGAGPATPPPVPRAPVLPREGAIPVLDVDGPMELESSFDKTVAWRPSAPAVAVNPPAPPVTSKAAAAQPPPLTIAPHEGRDALADDSTPVDLAPPVTPEAPVPEDDSSLPDFVTPAWPPPVIKEAIPPAAPEALNESFPEEWDLPPASTTEAPAPSIEPPTPTLPAAEAPPLSSSTLAELYFNQGFTRQALDVYRELLEREPGNERVAARIVELQAIDRELEGSPSAAPPPPAEPKVLRREAIERTITRLEAFLATVRRA